MRAHLPAYARELADARRRRLRPRDPTVSIVLHWRARPCIGYGVVVSDADDPSALDWTFLRGLDAILWRFGDEPARVRAAVGAIRAARPRRLLILDIACAEGEVSRIVNVVRPEAGHAHAIAA